MKERKCLKCGGTIPRPRNSTIFPRLCPKCQLIEANKKKVKKARERKLQPKLFPEPKPKKRTPWREKPTKDMIIHVQKYIVNPYIRERDQRHFGISISDRGAIADAGHYYSRGAKPGLRFSPQNIHGQSKSGNMHKGGDLINFRAGLVLRYGEEYVQELDRLARMTEGTKSLDRVNVKLIAETYIYLKKNDIWVFTHSDFENYKMKLYEHGEINP